MKDEKNSDKNELAKSRSEMINNHIELFFEITNRCIDTGFSRAEAIPFATALIMNKFSFES